MFKNSFVFVFTLLFVASIFAQDTFTVNNDESKIEWIGRKVTGQHNGTINLKNGTLQFEGDKLIGGKFEIDMTSMVNLDIEDESYKAKLIGHLKSDDFFSVDKYPVAIFTITHIQKNENTKGHNYFIRGDLTIKGTTHPVEFPAKIGYSKNKITASASITVDRSKYDVRYGSGSFFKGLGDNLIYDDFNLNVSLIATK
ncbi:MAG: YceI family protein [Calditrichaceae bacterium]|nr:YceI family protein [Calditrichaceae bacterium]MBN2708677.1 YceI family protein [Calditrichaceae bacterium]RQV96764.1 MAG: YceI family protein [Calditrichota bacterium]